MHRAKTRRWLAGHRSDPAVRRAAAEGWRSRAALKLVEIDDRTRLLAPGRLVLDLGAAPGGWSQVAAGRGCKVVAVDLIALAPLAQVSALCGDICEAAVRTRLATALGRKADLVLCDAAPNLSGVQAADAAACRSLHEAAIDCALVLAGRGSSLVLKTFAGSAQEAACRIARRHYASVRLIRPGASRRASSEIYLIAGSLQKSRETAAARL